MRSLLIVWLLSVAGVYSGCYSPEEGADPQGAAKEVFTQPVAQPQWLKDPVNPRPQTVVAAADVLPLEALAGVEEPALQYVPEEFSAARPYASEVTAARRARGGYATVVIPQRRSGLGELGTTGGASVFDRPFRAWFASVFTDRKHSGEDPAAVSLLDSSEAAQNPFTEAKLEAESASAAEASTARQPQARQDRVPTPATQNDNKTSDARPPQQADQAVSSGTPAKSDPGILFLGDFDGSGVLRWVQSQRKGTARFAFDDGERSFNFLVNPDAVAQQRSFTVEDLNADGKLDLVVTSRASLFGGVLAGDGAGNFAVVDSFVTGYEPTVAVPGPVVNGWRDIMAVDVRTGTLTTFRGGKHYRPLRFQNLDYVPEFAAHLVDLADGSDFFVAGSEGRALRIFRWREDGLLDGSADTIPPDAISVVVRPIGPQGTTATFSVFQVGPYASVVVADAEGRRFNVATMRISSKALIAFGDIEQNGALDVAVAFHVPASPE